MGEALGLIETRGLVGAIEAADAMGQGCQCSAGGYEKIGSGTCHRHGEGAMSGPFGLPSMLEQLQPGSWQKWLLPTSSLVPTAIWSVPSFPHAD